MSFFVIQRILAFLLSGFEMLNNPFRKSTITIVIVMILVEGHIQFIVFTFFRQIRSPAAHVFLDKVNLVVAVLFMFVVLFYTVTSYVLFSWFLTKKEVKVLYPFTTKSKAKTMALVMFLGPGRNFLLGVFQSFYENFELQMMLLIGLNFVTLLIFRILKNTNIPNYLMIFKNGSIIIITIFLTAGLFSSMNFVLASETYSAIQLICICSLWSICVLDFFYGFTSFMIELVH